MAFLKSASLPSVASLGGSNLQYLGVGSQQVTTTDDSSLKVANGGDEDGMLFVVYSHTGRPVAMGMWAAGNESPPRSASSIANYGYTFDVGDGGYGEDFGQTGLDWAQLEGKNPEEIFNILLFFKHICYTFFHTR